MVLLSMSIQLVSTCATLLLGESEGPVYVDVTK